MITVSHLFVCFDYLRPSQQFFSRGDGLFVCFFVLRPKSTAMVMAGRSVDLTTLFPGQA